MTRRTYRRRRHSAGLGISRKSLLAGLGALIAALGLMTLWAYFSADQQPLIRRWLEVLTSYLGWAAYLAPLFLLGLGGLLLQQAARRPWRWPWLELTGLFILLVVALALTNLLADGPLVSCSASLGGLVGCMLGTGLVVLVGSVTAVILLSVAGVAGLLLVLHIPLKRVTWLLAILLRWIALMARRLGLLAASAWRGFRRALQDKQPSQPVINLPKPAPARPASPPSTAPAAPASEHQAVASQAVVPTQPSSGAAESADLLTCAPQAGHRNWVLPAVRDILLARQDAQISVADIRARARVIEQTLQSLGVPATVVEVNPGPVVTQYGIEPGYLERYDRYGEIQRSKVKVSRIAALSNDLALALAASPIRIEAPVPGKGIVGLEVPNGQVATVGLRGVIESQEFLDVDSKLAVALGRDVSGRSVVADVLKLPHMLIAGATNSGKSVCLNAIIACFLLHNTPDELKLILVDPKRVELSQYNGIPHLLAPVVVEPERVLGVLNWLTREMDRRYRTFSAAGARNIEVYNAKAASLGEERLPYIVLVMDELADLMIVSPEDVERAICRLAQMARATGIHLIIATQRPSVDVVTGLIKANFPARIAFAVTSQIDSRVILDTPGAEKLLGRGDSLFMSPSSPQLLRVQGCFVSEGELSKLIAFWRTQANMPVQEPRSTTAVPVVQPQLWSEEDLGAIADGQDNQMLAKARDIVTKTGKASVSLLQRNLGIGYTRAARLIDQLEKEGLIGPATGTSKPRELIVHDKDNKIIE